MYLRYALPDKPSKHLRLASPSFLACPAWSFCPVFLSRLALALRRLPPSLSLSLSLSPSPPPSKFGVPISPNLIHHHTHPYPKLPINHRSRIHLSLQQKGLGHLLPRTPNVAPRNRILASFHPSSGAKTVSQPQPTLHTFIFRPAKRLFFLVLRFLPVASSKPKLGPSHPQPNSKLY